MRDAISSKITIDYLYDCTQLAEQVNMYSCAYLVYTVTYMSLLLHYIYWFVKRNNELNPAETVYNNVQKMFIFLLFALSSKMWL